jgi:hypothetical protein
MPAGASAARCGFDDSLKPGARFEARGLPKDVQRAISRVQTADEARKSHSLRLLKKRRPD